MLETVSEVEEKEEYFTLRVKIPLFLIAGAATAANFIARTFTGLYAVIIGASPLALSFITSLRNLIQQAVQSSFGRLSDKLGRRLLMFLGLLGSCISLALFPLIQNGWVLVGGVVCFSIGFSCYYPALTALQGDITTRENRAGLIGLITSIGAFASIIGLLVVGFASNLGGSEWLQYTIILEITAGLFLVTAIITLFLVDPPTEKLTERPVFTLAPIIKNRTFRKFVIVNCVMAFFMSLGWPIFPFVREEFATAQQNSWAWAIFCFFQIIALYVSKPFINKIKRKRLLFFGRILIFYVPLNLAITVLWVPFWWHMALAGVASGAGFAFFMVGQNSYILDCAPEEEKGTYTGVHNFFIGLITFIGSLLMGAIAEVLILRFEKWFVIVVLLFIIAGGRFLASFGYLFVKEPAVVRKERKSEEEKQGENLKREATN